jgi:rhodanese-related sulfurtransferase
MSRDHFISMMTTDLPEAPVYFSSDAEINREGARPLESLSKPKPLSPAEVMKLARDNSGYIVLDVRSAADFGAGHVPGSLNIGLGGQFAIWAGCLMPLQAPVVIVAESEEKVEEAVVRLARVGIEHVLGYLSGGVAEWAKAGYELATVPQISVTELNELIGKRTDIQVVDVRRPPEYQNGHAPRAVPAPLSTLKQHLENLNLDPAKTTAVICAGGYRSSAATSILQEEGFSDLLNVTGGTNAWVNAGYPVES